MVSLEALTLSIALGYNQYTSSDESLEPEYGYRVELGHEEYPVYLFGGYEDPTVRIRGQGVGVAEILSIGVGAKKDLGDFFVFGEIGYGKVEQEDRPSIIGEVVYTELVGNHNVYNRPVPVDLRGPYDATSFDSSWELDDGILGAVGVGYEFNDHLSATIAYRPFYVQEYIHIANPGAKEAGLGYWEEHRSRDLSAFQFHVAFTF